jgi:hypothetical protein
MHVVACFPLLCYQLCDVHGVHGVRWYLYAVLVYPLGCVHASMLLYSALLLLVC